MCVILRHCAIGNAQVLLQDIEVNTGSLPLRFTFQYEQQAPGPRRQQHYAPEMRPAGQGGPVHGGVEGGGQRDQQHCAGGTVAAGLQALAAGGLAAT